MENKSLYTHIVVHYSEIAIKGKNRSFFERKLIDNIKFSCKGLINSVKNAYGRMIIVLKDSYYDDDLMNKLSRIPGIAYFAPTIKSKLDINDIKEVSLKLINSLSNKDSSFKVFTKRQNKNFSFKSPEISMLVGEHIINNSSFCVKLNNPDIPLCIEVCDNESYVYLGKEKVSSVGGLPVGSSGNLISSLSGGFDSPVASYLMMKRGCKIVFVHAHNKNQQSVGVEDKIISLVNKLNDFQGKSKLYLVPFDKIQEEIILSVPSKFRMILYRRFMLRIMNSLAFKEGALGIVTGDSVGQVASQTLENINSIRSASKFPVLSPLIGMNKQEIIDLSIKLGTHDISTLPSSDCCSFMISEHPEIKSRLSDVEVLESKILNIDKLISEAIKNSVIKNFD